MRSKADRRFWGWEEEAEELALDGRIEEGGGIAVWMEAAGDAGAAGTLDAEALGADGDAPIGADFGVGALAPDIGPPGAVWGGAQDGAFLCESQLPGGLRGGAQFDFEAEVGAVDVSGFDDAIGVGADEQIARAIIGITVSQRMRSTPPMRSNSSSSEAWR